MTLISSTTRPQLLVSEKLESCKSVKQIKQIHAIIIKSNPPIPIHLLYAKITSLLHHHHHHHQNINHLRYACSVAKLCHRNPVHLFNSLIQILSLSIPNSFPKIFTLYTQMLLIGLSPDSYTLPYLLKACTHSHAFSEALQLHAHAVKTGLFSSVFVKNTLLRVYAVCGRSITSVQKVFDLSPHSDLVSWTTLIQAYADLGYPSQAVDVFFRMTDWIADPKVLVVVLSACSQLGDFELGMKVRDYMDQNCIDVHSDVFLGNALVDMYFKCGQPELGCRLFREMPVKNVVSWNSVISGLAQQGQFKEALDMFRRMQNVGLKPDAVTLVAVLNSCANLGVLELGKWAHSYMDKIHIKGDGYVGNALVDMYAKCGCIDEAFKAFQAMKCRDVYSYTAMIVGFAIHGKAHKALDVFSEMNRVGIHPDHVTFVGVLYACSHAGLVEEGRRHFEDMSRLYHLQPQTEHYGCMVDLLGRAGLISEAHEFINKMPILPDAAIWGSLLGSCKIYAEVELGESVIQKLVELEPDRDGAYMLISNLYSSANRWRDALKWRKVMKQKHVNKTPGCSSIEVDGTVHEFRKGEKSHPSSKKLHKLLQQMNHHLRNYGCKHDGDM
ncbi:pentatricopeptide repeat-containing protein At1g08070, chloroplastic-like [Mercurialis annua]|uniref:pentatricopeptide repeat-containing protein At1g08070, chloroplastic-like n=1 Tax=Mercurialis annua TaxID=3986 RepID=UPI00215E8127|nr:pentatricopeptide repeat-containing protein At1g08070, chloroplastic-like [Mercurialis annua]